MGCGLLFGQIKDIWGRRLGLTRSDVLCYEGNILVTDDRFLLNSVVTYTWLKNLNMPFTPDQLKELQLTQIKTRFSNTKTQNPLRNKFEYFAVQLDKKINK